LTDRLIGAAAVIAAAVSVHWRAAGRSCPRRRQHGRWAVPRHARDFRQIPLQTALDDASASDLSVDRTRMRTATATGEREKIRCTTCRFYKVFRFGYVLCQTSSFAARLFAQGTRGFELRRRLCLTRFHVCSLLS